MSPNKNLLCNAAWQRYAGANEKIHKSRVAAYKTITRSIANIQKDARTIIK